MKNITWKNIICTLLLLLGVASAQSQIVTSSADDGGAGTLRNQIATADEGDIIIFAIGVDNITLTGGEIEINKSLTITGNLITNTIIDGNDNGRIFNITSGDVILNDVEITNGTAADGGAIMIIGADVTISGSTISNSIANGASGSGGGIYVGTGAALTMLNSSVTGNMANRAGGGIESTAGTFITLTNVNLDSNNAGVAPATAAPGNGGGLHITGAGDAEINGGTVNNNMAAAEGGGLWNGAGSMDIIGTEIDENMASGIASDNGGGGIYNLSGMLSIENAMITNNDANGAAGSGGGILNDAGGMLTISTSTISNNTANRAGGGIEVNSGAAATVTLSDVILNNNTVFTSPGNGGGLHVTGAGIVNIENGTVNNNTAGAEGGGLWNGSGTMTIDGTTINENTASGAGADQGGGGIYNLNGGTLVIINAFITNNDATGTLGSGGGILNDVGSQLSITDTAITGNAAVRAGGGIEDNSGTSTILLNSVNLDNNTVSGPPGNGGGLHITGGGNVTITDGTVNGNSAALEGGGLWNGTGTMTINGAIVNGNTASGTAADDGGGGIFNNGGTLNISGAEITNNVANGTSGSGGGIFSIAGAVTIDISTIDSNSANRAGGGLEIVAGTLAINNSELTNNDVDGTAGAPNPGNGGALHISAIATTTITDSNIAENDARREGGGLWNQTGSGMTVTDCIIDSNTASGPDAIHGGGGIFNNGGTLVVVTSSIINNIADGALGNGGGIHIKSGSGEILVSTISGNSSANDGGGIYSNANLAVTSCTIAENTATATGGGIANGIGTLVPTFLMGTIVATNSAATGFDVSSGATYNSGGYNLIGQDDLNTFTETATDIVGTNATPVDPLLGPLADNGGTTPTHALLQDSPAYNAGDPLDNGNDQIGNPVFGSVRDIGAFESQTVLGVNAFAFANGSRSIIYPNPSVNGFVNIQLANGFGNDVNARMIEIASGKVVREFKLTANTNEVNVTGFSSGVYAIQLVSESATEEHKVVIR